ncbi:MAG: amidohydrolase family protein [Clostridia bacterium]|nr:amidohydrolase family protein [Clostridia bacterium]
MKRIKSNQFVLADGIFSGYLYFEGGKILQLTCDELPVEQEYDLTDCYVSAGFIDLHTHGGGGHPFEGTVEDVIEGCAFHLKHGTTAICPTIAAAPIAEMAQAAKNVEAAMRDPRVKGTILGSHLEGPYLSAAQCGAQCPRHITPPVAEDYLPLLKECSSIVRWSYAPENDAGERFAKALKQYGVVAAAGHTDAIYDDMKRAMAQGCNLVTHLYSCTSTVTRDHGFRRLGVIETAYLEDDLFVEIICDGKHLPSELIRLIYKLKGRGRIALITDSLSLAGTEAKEGILQDTAYVIEDGVCKLLDRSAFAGSIATADRLVRVAVKEAGISVVDAVYMLTETPAAIMGLQNKGRLAAGMDADLVAFDENINIKKVFAMGEEI